MVFDLISFQFQVNLVLLHNLFGTGIKDQCLLEAILFLTFGLLITHLHSPEHAEFLGRVAELAGNHLDAGQPPAREARTWIPKF